MHHNFEKRASIAALLHCSGIGWATVRTIQKYLTKYEYSWADFWVLSRAKLAEVGCGESQIDSILSFKKEYKYSTYYESLLLRDIRLIIAEDDVFPVLLTRTAAPPPALFVRGSTAALQGLPVAVVGTRSVTPYGLYVTRLLVSQLVEGGCSILSGGMYGVDMAAHLETVRCGGITWVFLGHGFDHIYPQSLDREHQLLAEAGAVFCSPFAPSIRPSKVTFPIRNQVVAGSSAGVVVTEAAERSGSHITAACAAEEGRQVFAVPGPITNPYSRGTQALLAQGALCCSSGEEVIAELALGWGGIRKSHQDQRSSSGMSAINDVTGLSEVEQLVYSAIGSGTTTVQALASAVSKQMSEIHSALTVLELRKLVMVKGGQFFLR